jgi:hypothetical protein
MKKSKYTKYLPEAIEIYEKQTTKSAVQVAKEIYKKYQITSNFDTFRLAINKMIRLNNTEVKPKAKQRTKKTEAQPFVLSAWNFKTGEMMDVDEYCEFYKLPRADVKSYKLVSHTGTPYYNILFKQVEEIAKDLTAEYIAAAIKKYAKPVLYKKPAPVKTNLVDRIVYTDAHIGMEPNKSGFSLYGGNWGETELMDQLHQMVNFIVTEKKGNKLIIDDLGDYLDGWSGETVRKGHSLPQNMDNQAMFDVGVKFKIQMVDMLVQHYPEIEIHNICEDNHAGAFGYVVNSAFKQLVELKYKNVKVVNCRKFINHYYEGNHCFVISHGKDSKNLKFGFKPHLDAKQIEKIDQYLKQNQIFKKADYIEFSKGDSHQMLFDYCTSDDFDYMNYLAFSPSSEWVQTNFKKGRSGFILQHIDPKENFKVVKPYFFTNNFKKVS